MDALDFAITMELDGQKYYEEQAALHPGDGLKAVFEILAGDERGHAALLKGRRDGLAVSPVEPERPGLKNVFNGMAAFKSDIKYVPGQVDAYRMAMEKEQQSISLYRKLLLESGDKELFEFLIRQEEEHFEILEEIVKVVSRPDSWVESSEFGLREEY